MGGGSASFGENVKTPQICENAQIARFMDHSSSLGIDISSKQNIDKDSFLRSFASNVV